MDKSIVNNSYKNFMCKQSTTFFIILGIFMLYLFFLPDAHAALDTLGNKVNSRIMDIVRMVDKTAKVVVGLGFLYFIITFLKGEPNYRYAGCLTIGGCLLILASQVTAWMLA